MQSVDLSKTEGIPEGLTSAEAEELRRAGKINVTNTKVGKSYRKIIADNLFTYFNLIWAIVAVLLALCRSFTNMTFLAIITPNILISMVQEIRAKKTVEKLTVTTDPKATVIRDGQLVDVPSEEILLGDVMLLEMGRQILSDAVVISGLCEVNESMLTGESDAIKKSVGDTLLAGSYLVGGSVYAKVKHVGCDNYVHKIESSAKNFKAPTSNLFNELNKLIKSIGAALVPLSVILFISNFLSYRTLTTAIIKTCGSITGMIPAGMYLLVTVTLTLSVINLSKKRTLVRDMYSIEMLASADVICLDKTGTITDGTMRVSEVTPLAELPLSEIERIMSHIEGTEQSINNTSAALIERFGKDVSVKIIKKVPFSSERKYSQVSIKGLGAYSIGAPHFVPCPISSELDEVIANHAKEGERVLVLSEHENLDTPGRAIALIAISDRIRPSAKETIARFQENGVTVKVISGDHAETVSTIAGRVGITNADKYISCENLTDEQLILAADEYTVFGRVTPEQKVLLVKTLKIAGHTVAMTGDGVNDTLALKEAHCAIAMADGSEMARKVANLVLMDSDFAALPAVVNEGRRCINNVRQSSVLYLMKTIFTILLSVISIITFAGYPFEPRQLMLLEMFIIGIASVLLALEPNHKRIEGSFLNTVIVRSFPDALALLTPVVTLMILGHFGMPVESRNAIAMAAITLVGFINLMTLCTPFTKWRFAVVALTGLFIGISIPVSIYLLDDMLGFKPILNHDEYSLLILFLVLALSIVVSVIMQIFRGKLENFFKRKLEQSKSFTDKMKARRKG